MAILNNSNAISTAGGYDINNSLRFRASASAYLSRTPASAGNRQIFTLSTWVKRGTFPTGNGYKLFSAYNGDSDSGWFDLRFQGDNTLMMVTWNWTFYTSAVFRDPSAWYHVVLAVDTTQATAANRIKIYVNGVQYTLSGSTATQNTNLAWNNSIPSNIGRHVYNSSDFYDGYMTEIYNIDGQALTPSSFGETDTDTGSWKPKAYTSTYGTNGFYLKFSDIATTSGSNAGLGKDFSGNANYWNTNNISVTAGTTYDAMIDSPTLTSATVANYAVLNPLDKGSGQTITEANLYLSAQSGGGIVKSSIAYPTSGKWYLEWTYNGSFNNIGIATLATLASTTYAGSASTTWGYYSGDGKIYTNSVGTAYGATWNTAGTVIGVAFDADAGTLTFYKNGVSQGTAVTGLTTTQYIFIAGNDSGMAGYANFGQRPFVYTPPTGYVRLNTYNLPDGTIKKGNTVMDATLYTGNGGATQTITNAALFKPDFVWVKSRSAAYRHGLFDSVRGVGSGNTTDRLQSNATDAQDGGPYMSSLNSNGFTITNYNATYTENATTYVGWQWQAGQGSTSSNTSGSITSTVSVNATAGFSIVTYTGTGANATVGHGLGVAPRMIIVKQRNTTRSWYVYHASLASAANNLVLDSTSAALTDTLWNSTAPTSSVFSLGANIGGNQSTGTYVAYCWAEIAGFSKFGSYTGNGSTDGPFIYLGFRPKFVIIKKTSGAGNWITEDSIRDTYNPEALYLLSNSAQAENSLNPTMDFTANGFKMRADDGNLNTSSSTYIYMAFAENPFKNANAR